VRVPVNRMRTYLLGLGARMPAYATAQGRMLLAHLSDSALDRLSGDALLMPLTGRTLTDKTQLRAELVSRRTSLGSGRSGGSPDR
jgi:IclR family pca regulon transcriptional regulator